MSWRPLSIFRSTATQNSHLNSATCNSWHVKQRNCDRHCEKRQNIRQQFCVKPTAQMNVWKKPHKLQLPTAFHSCYLCFKMSAKQDLLFTALLLLHPSTIVPSICQVGLSTFSVLFRFSKAWNPEVVRQRTNKSLTIPFPFGTCTQKNA